MAMHKTARSLILLLLTSACSAIPLVRSTPRPVPAPASGPSGPSTAGPWLLRPNSAPQGVVVTTTAVVTIAGDPVTRIDTLRAVLDANYARLPGNPRRIDGRLMSFQVSSGAGSPAPVPGLTLPARFSAEVGGTTPGFRLPAESKVCGDPSLSVMQGLYDAWTTLPDTIGGRTEWTDTVHTTSCRDRVPMKGTSTRRFKVTRADIENGRVVLTVERRAKTVMSGEGEQFGEHVAIDGQGESTLRYVLDPGAARWLRASGTAVLELSFKSRLRSQRVKQESQVSLAWTP
jgi:hypothetical protein